MIFVAVGTQKFQFDRLIQSVDKMVAESGEEVFGQIGNSTYLPKHFSYKRFLTKNEFRDKIRSSEMVITHSGVATIIEALQENKPVIVMPRLQRFGEHVDDHQMQIAKCFDENELVLMCTNGNELADLVTKAKSKKFNKYISHRNLMISAIENYLKEEKRDTDYMNKVKVLMCGSELSVKGGMVSVIKNYLDYNKWNEFRITYVPTHTEKNKIVVAIYFILAYIRLMFLALFGNYKIIYLHTAERGSFFRKAILVRTMKKLGIKTVMHHHAAEFEEFYANASPKKKAYIKRTLEMVDLNIVLSKRLIPMIQEKAPSAKVQVLYNAVQVPKKNPYSKDARNVLFLGRMGQRKGIYDLLNAMEDMRNELPEDVQFYLCGDGEVNQVKAEVKKRGLEGRVAHIGWTDGEQKKEFMKMSMINVLPSYHEGLPMTILETMAQGIPNVSTDIASIPEVIEDGSNGFMIHPGDVESLKNDILLLIENENERCRISDNAWKTVINGFSLDANISDLKKHLHILLEE